MNKIRYRCVFIVILLVSILMAPFTVSASDGEPVVRAVLFWMDGCAHCHYVLEQVLPPLEQEYGDQLEILSVELTDADSVNLLYQAAASFGMAKENVGVPFLVIGDVALVGSEQIPAQLPGLIEMHLAAGGVEYPDLPGLQTILPSLTSSEVSEPTLANPPAQISQLTGVKWNGFGLAILVLVAMLAALAYAGLHWHRRSTGKSSRRQLEWQDPVVPLLTITGLVVAGYLTYVETQAVQAVCGPVGDCNAVQSSPYARLFGILPVGILGLLGYAAILSAWYLRRFHPRLIAPYDSGLIFAMAFFGTLFSIYLTFLELFIIRAVCLWCLSSAIIMTTLMLVSLGPARKSVERIDRRMRA